MDANPAKAVHVTKFADHSHEDPNKFLDELDSYLILHGIRLNAADRRCAALHLHLTGPALSWYQRLTDQVKFNWQALRYAFLQRYNDMERTYRTDIEKFHSLALQPTQRIEDFYAVVLDLGTRLQLTDRDIMYRFIAGLGILSVPDNQLTTPKLWSRRYPVQLADIEISRVSHFLLRIFHKFLEPTLNHLLVF